MNDLETLDSEDTLFSDENSSINAVSTYLNPMGEAQLACRQLDKAMRRMKHAMCLMGDEANLNNMHLNITLGGAITGDMKLEYGFGTTSYGDKAESHTPINALIEMMRRNGWEQRNEAKLLSPARHSDGEDL